MLVLWSDSTRVDAYFFRCITTCGSRVSFFKAGFLWLFNMRSSCQRHHQRGRGLRGLQQHHHQQQTPTSAASFILLIMALTTSSASLMKVPPSRWRLLLLFMAFLRASMMSKSDMKLQLQTNICISHQQPVRSSDVGPEETLELEATHS